MTAQIITTATDLAPAYDIIIVGAGPAGLTAATEVAAHSISALVINESSEPGGQMYRAITRLSPEAYEFLGPDYWQGTALVDAFHASRISYAPRTAVWSLAPAGDAPFNGAGAGLEVGISLAGEARLLRARHVILATGAFERPMPVPGWTLPGVMTAGAGQVALKSAGLVPEGRVVLAGCGPMLYLLVYQLLAAGARISAVLDTTDRRQLPKAVPYLPDFTRSAYFWKGVKLLVKVLSSVRFVRGVTGLEAVGNGRVEKLRFRTGRKWNEIDADVVMLHQGVVPDISLASSAGCALNGTTASSPSSQGSTAMDRPRSAVFQSLVTVPPSAAPPWPKSQAVWPPWARWPPSAPWTRPAKRTCKGPCNACLPGFDAVVPFSTSSTGPGTPSASRPTMKPSSAAAKRCGRARSVRPLPLARLVPIS